MLPLLMLVAGCATQPTPTMTPTPVVTPVTTDLGAQRHVLNQPPTLLINRGSAAEPMSWPSLIDQAIASDVVILGEQHDDAVGHAVQLALVEAVLQQCPGAAVAFEMLERDEQVLLDDYRDGIIDAKTLTSLTNSAQWGGAGSWEAWYQPIIDAGLNHDAMLIAANAPRRYVRVVRTDGFGSLDSLDRTRSGFVEIPNRPITGPYRDRFMELMADHGDDVDSEMQESFFHSQQLWDSTMADSVVAALRKGRRPVILLVGRFHSDRDGGTVQYIKRARPYAKVLVISLEPNQSPADPLVGGGDDGVAHDDVIVFTGP